MENLEKAKLNTIQGLSRISHFWGFPKAMGAIFGVLYLSPQPLSLDELVENVGVTKGAISTNIRQLERLGLVHKHFVLGTRKDYYLAETDFWKIVKGILQERNQSEFDLAINTITESLEMVDQAKDLSAEASETASFYKKRLQNMQEFFNTLDRLVALILALDSFRIKTFEQFFNKVNRNEQR